MVKILLDSSILIDFLRIKNKKDSLLFELTEKNYQLYAAIITHTELFSGKSVWERRGAYSEVKDLFFRIAVLPMTEEISEKAGEIKAKFDLNIADAIIAATAILTNLELVTLNIKDFKKVENLKLLNIGEF